MRRLLLRGSVPAFGAISYAAYSNRPVYHESLNLRRKPDDYDGSSKHVTLGVAAVSTTASLAERPDGKLTEDEVEFLRTGLYSPPTKDESVLLKAARAAAIASVTAISMFFIEVLNDFRVIGNERNHRYLMDLVEQGKDRDRGMITVSNHTSVFDDPVLQSCLTSFIHPDKMRWGVCKDTICFSNAFSASFTGAGKVLPVRVGAGIEQPAFKAAGRRLAEGEWVHIYPEAACIQSGTIGKGQIWGCRKEDKAKDIGLLKWGVGKLAARTAFQAGDVPPLIIPYYHLGMDKVKPQRNTPESNGLLDPWYIPGRVGNEIRVFVGPPIDVADLIQEYEKKHGKRRIARVREDNSFVDWEGSTEAERELHSRITKRVEEALLKLEEEALEYQRLKQLQKDQQRLN